MDKIIYKGQNCFVNNGTKSDSNGNRLWDILPEEFDMWDEQEDLGLHTRFGYGTKFDGDSIDLDICCDCFDKLMDKFIPMCKINPITEMD